MLVLRQEVFWRLLRHRVQKPIHRNLCTSRDSIAVKTPEWKQKEGLIVTEAQVPLLLSLNTQALLSSLFIDRFMKLL